MDGIVEFLGFWMLYLAFAALGFWCWRRLFFWLKPGTDIRRFCHMLGAVLLFTPAPIEAGSVYFAPAMVVFPFTLLTASMQQAAFALNWFLGGLVVGALVLAVVQLARFVQRRRVEVEPPRG